MIRTGQTEIPGGKAKFAPLQVKVTDKIGNPLKDVMVNFRVGIKTRRMAVQIDPGGAKSVAVRTNLEGIATLSKMGGYSVMAYYDTGKFSIDAIVEGGPVATFYGEATDQNLTIIERLKLTIIDGNNQTVIRTPDGSINGGSAKFAPLQVKVTDENGDIVKDVVVNFQVKTKPARRLSKSIPAALNLRPLKRTRKESQR